MKMLLKSFSFLFPDCPKCKTSLNSSEVKGYGFNCDVCQRDFYSYEVIK